MVPLSSAGPVSSEISNFSLINSVISEGSQCNSQVPREHPAPHHLSHALHHLPLSHYLPTLLPLFVSPSFLSSLQSSHTPTSLQTKGAELIETKHCPSAEISTRPDENFSEEIMLLCDPKMQNDKLLITFFKSSSVQPFQSVRSYGTEIERQMSALIL